jgi:hypothetical protein
MRKFIYSLLVAHLVLICLVACKSGGGDTLKFNPGIGKVYDFTMESKLQQREGDSIGATIDLQTFYSMKLVSAEKGLNNIEVTYNDMIIDINNPQMPIKVDTRNQLIKTLGVAIDAPQIITRMFYAMKGKTLHLVVKDDGTVIGLTGTKEVADAVIKDMDLPEEYKETAMLTFSQQFNDENIKSQMQRVYFMFPGTSVKKGQTWDKEVKASGMLYRNHYTVKSIEGDAITIELSSSFTSEDKATGIDGTEKGEISIDKKSGMITQSILTGDTRQEGGSIHAVTTITSKSR